jgi:hypothetical protein
MHTQSNTENRVAKHEWKCISPGEYDFLYECSLCGSKHMESIDKPGSEPPLTGCTPISNKENSTAVATGITDSQRLEWLLKRLTGKSLREAGVVYSDGIRSARDAIDSSMRQE